MKKWLAAFAALWTFPALAAPPAIDGNSGWGGTLSPTTSFSVTLTTTQPNDAIVVYTAVSSQTCHVARVTDGAGLTYSRRAIKTGPIAQDYAEEWYAVSAGVLMADVITVNYQCAVSTAGVGAFGISGAQMPVPFDPLFGAQAITISQGQAVVTTLGTDDLIIGLYRFAGCTSYAVGAGWNAIITPAGTSNVMEYQTFNSAQAGLTVPISGCGTNTIQTGFVDAFVAADGLGSLQQSSKLNTYIVLQTGMGTSKQNMYVVAVPGIGTSKLNGYAILQGQMNVINPKTGLTVFHAFPP